MISRKLSATNVRLFFKMGISLRQTRLFSIFDLRCHHDFYTQNTQSAYEDYVYFSNSLNEDGKCFTKIDTAGGYIVRKTLKIVIAIRLLHSYFLGRHSFYKFSHFSFIARMVFTDPSSKTQNKTKISIFRIF